MTTKYFKAIIKGRDGKKHTIRGTAFIDMGQTITSQIHNIAGIQGHGTVKEIVSVRVYSSGEEWYEDEYGKDSLEHPKKRVLSTAETGKF